MTTLSKPVGKKWTEYEDVYCAACRTLITFRDPRTTLSCGSTACSPSCAMTLIFRRVEAMSAERAYQRLGELLRRGAMIDGRHGGLDEEAADEVRFLAQRLGVALVWEKVELEEARR